MALTSTFFYLTIAYSVLVSVVMLIQSLSHGRLLNHQCEKFVHTSIILLGGMFFYYWQTLYLKASWSTAIILPLVLGVAIVHGLSVKAFTVLAKLKFGTVWVSYICLAISLLECTSLIHLAARHFETGGVYSDLVCAEPPGVIHLVEDHYATTDLGTRIRLYRREVTDQDFAKFAKLSALSMRNATEKAMRRAAPSNISNCHGWVFTNGNHILSSCDVPRVLEENGYRQVDKPSINDVVTYQDHDGIVIHTGIVRALYDGNTPMVESKWGMTAVYVHLVSEQPYSENFTFWRSSRITHQLTTYRDAKLNLDMARISSQTDLKF